ncbi:hypothetical protein G6045_37205 [Streptomyces sp. YC504]|uniref:Uncharacterized protein n=1 Tax=Streptomyces mesophilus TaxID=1775132 RepID=A0A6G4XVQ5_9ACTN|nr:hypothetical protein [Streptomyces mesophilus]NGO81262.1 hypothetical protein [Streptomyces mesophilus]
MPAFDQRVVTLVRLVGTRTDRTLFEDECGAQGWEILRGPNTRQHAARGDRTVEYTVEVRLLGSALGATYGARIQMEYLGDELSLDLTVLAAELVDRRPISTKAWHAYVMPGAAPSAPWDVRWQRIRRYFGWLDTGRQVHAPTDAAAMTLTRRPLPGTRPAPAGVELRGGEPGPAIVGRLGRQALRVRLMGLGHLWVLLWVLAMSGSAAEFVPLMFVWGILATLAAAHAYAYWGVALWKVLAILVPFTAAIWLKDTLKSFDPPGHWSAPGLQLLFTAYAVAVGLRLLIRNQRTRSWVPWLIPAALPVALALFPGLGSVVHTYYLEEFGLDREDVDIPRYWQAIASAKVVAAMSVWLVAPAFWGYLRHFHRVVRDRWFYGAVTALVAIVSFAAGPLYFVIRPAAEAGVTAVRAATAGRTPSGYYGIDASWVCVAPRVSLSELPSEGAAITPASPYLMLGDASGKAALWRDGHAVKVPLNKVLLVPATSPARCDQH